MKRAAHAMHEPMAIARIPLEGELFVRLENWRRSQPKIPSRNGAIRILLWQALKLTENQNRPPVPKANRPRGGLILGGRRHTHGQ